MTKGQIKQMILSFALMLLSLVVGHRIIDDAIAQSNQPSTTNKPELVIQNGHSDNVRSVAFHPEGKIIASGSWDNTIKFWDAGTGKLIRNLLGHSRGVNSISFSPDGRTLVSGSTDNTIKFWETSTGRLTRTLEGSLGPVSTISLSPNGKRLASDQCEETNTNGTCLRETIRVWDTNTGNLLRTLKGQSGKIWSVAFSPDGKLLASGGCVSIELFSCDSGKIEIWEADTGRLIRTIDGHYKSVDRIAFSPDGRTIASGGAYSITDIKLWEVSTGSLVQTFKGHSDPIESISFSPNGETMASGDGRGNIIIWALSTGRRIQTIKAHAWSLSSISFSLDGTKIVSGGTEGAAIYTVKIWDVQTGKLVQNTISSHSTRIDSVLFSPDGKTFASAGGEDYWDKQNSTIKLWDSTTGKLLRVFWGAEKPIVFISFSPDGSTIAASSYDSTVRLWETSTGKLIRTFNKGRSPDGLLYSLSFSPDGRTLAALCRRNKSKIYLWEVSTGREIYFEGFSDAVSSMSFCFDGTKIAWGQCVERSPNGSCINASIVIMDVESKTILRTFAGHSDSVSSILFCKDYKFLVSGSNDKTIKLWEVSTGKLIRTFEGHTNYIKCIALSPDEKFLASGSAYDNTIKLWDISTGNLVGTFKGHSREITSLSFSPDGKTLISGSVDTTIRFWDIGTQKCYWTLLPLDINDWVVYTDEGYFDTSENGVKSIGWTVGMKSYGAEQFWDEYYQPGLFSLVMSGQPMAVKKDLRQGFSLPPDVSIISPKAGETIDGETVDVSVQAIDIGGGVEDIRLYHNGALVGEGERGVGGVRKVNNIVTKVYRVTLLEGDNTLRATAYSGDHLVEAVPYEIKIRSAVAKKKPNLFLVAIGINKYQNLPAKDQLRYSRSDAKAIVAAFKPQEGKIYEKVYVTTLYDEQATKQKILDALKQPTRPQDVLVIYFAGHGIGIERKYYFLPYEVSGWDDASIKRDGISHEEIMGPVVDNKALKRLLLLDTCESGTLVVAMRGGGSEERAVDALNKTTGAHVISAANEAQGAGEAADYKHGFFTFALLEGLAGKADSNGNHIVEIFELLPYVSSKVKAIAERYGKEQQPLVRMSGGDFPVAVY